MTGTPRELSPQPATRCKCGRRLYSRSELESELCASCRWKIRELERLAAADRQATPTTPPTFAEVFGD